MSSSRFFRVTLSLAVAGAVAVAVMNWRINYYGVFGNVHGRALAPMTNQRIAKYLYGLNYVPANFDALLTGASSTNNLDTSVVRGYRMYNDSIGGGNVTDIRLVIENTLNHGRFRLVVFGLQPRLFETHGASIGPRDFGAALGSYDLFRDYGKDLWFRLRGRPNPYDTWGRVNFEELPPWPLIDADAAMNRYLEKYPPDQRALTVDEPSYAELRELIDFARLHSDRVMAYFPPVYERRYQVMRKEYADFNAKMSALFRPGETIIDANDGSLSPLLRDPASFQDGTHLTEKVAAKVSAALADSIEAAQPAPIAKTVQNGR